MTKVAISNNIASVSGILIPHATREDIPSNSVINPTIIDSTEDMTAWTITIHDSRMNLTTDNRYFRLINNTNRKYLTCFFGMKSCLHS